MDSHLQPHIAGKTQEVTHYNSHLCIASASTQLVIGILCIIFHVTSIILGSQMVSSYMGHGIIAGIFVSPYSSFINLIVTDQDQSSSK